MNSLLLRGGNWLDLAVFCVKDSVLREDGEWSFLLHEIENRIHSHSLSSWINNAFAQYFGLCNCKNNCDAGGVGRGMGRCRLSFKIYNNVFNYSSKCSICYAWYPSKVPYSLLINILKSSWAILGKDALACGHYTERWISNIGICKAAPHGVLGDSWLLIWWINTKTKEKSNKHRRHSIR